MTKEKKQEIQYLLLQYIEGKASLPQEAVLFQYLNEQQNDKELEEIFEELMAAEPETVSYNPDEWHPVLQAVLTKGRKKNNGQVRRLFSHLRWVAAASVLLIAGLGIYRMLKTEKPIEITLQSQEVRFKNDRTPGHDGAILTLANGNQIILDTTSNGKLANEGGTQIVKQDGQLTYNSNMAASDVTYNTMATPKGRQYRLVLADGSRVWLNAASSITYPTLFTGDERKVSITGEAYFEIAHNESKPFIVQKDGMRIEVLGTHFNVNAYDDETAIRTTLLEGKVKVAMKGKSRLLSPGQQARINTTGDINVMATNTEEAVAWKSGFFQFSNESIAFIMRQVARWYDVDVEFKGEIKQSFRGKIPREVSLADMFRILESTGWVHFTIDGRKITVMP